MNRAKPGRYIYASSEDDTVSNELPEWKNGAFTKALIEAFEGKAKAEGQKALTTVELMNFLRKRMKEIIKGDNNRKQIPGFEAGMRNSHYLLINRHPMKIILTAVFLLIAILSPATAQQGGDSYIVYSVAGSVKSAGHPIQPKQKLFPLQTITIGKESQLTLLNEDAKLLYSLNRTGTWTVKEYIHDMKPSVLRLSANYLRYIKDQLFSNTDDTAPNRATKPCKKSLYRKILHRKVIIC